MNNTPWLSFKLDEDFIKDYSNREIPWGHKDLSEIVYYRTYSRVKPNGKKEHWYETIRRVVEGCYTFQKNHIKLHNLPWDESKAQRSARRMYHYMFTMKFLPAGRGLWMMGTEYVHTRSSMALFNCAFVSLEDFDELNPTEAFEFLMDVSMLGVGCGFDTHTDKPITLIKPTENTEPNVFVVPDTKEGWIEAMARVIKPYFHSKFQVTDQFDVSLIRPIGTPIKGFGGKQVALNLYLNY